ncbi:hypothetical protein NVS89_22670 [Ancylobacter sp. MQZ15Z-1]|uniref:Uncharacterized protein n=1 Tax=Ancylobacter mangrovi TaxID=2972472 RepID=A0A9X2PI69_9HYPH|nr:hypothetical protein [Ancylobacter mangrovi]MCS0497899.1 hypothetical protein [Ancylobacter mangrovi]
MIPHSHAEESQLARTPEFQAARAIELAASELETLRLQALDLAETLSTHIRSLKARSRDMRDRPFRTEDCSNERR